MNKTLMGLIALGFLSPAVAGNITPEMTRSKSVASDSALGLAWSKRNSVGFNYLNQEQDYIAASSATQLDSSTFAPSLYLSHNDISLESVYAVGEVIATAESSSNESFDVTGIDTKVAFRMTPSLATVLGFQTLELDHQDETTKTREVELGLSYKNANGVIYGLSYIFNNTKNDEEISLDYNSISFGVGYQEFQERNGYSIEGLFKTNSEKNITIDSDTYAIAQSSSLSVQWLYAMDSFQVDSELLVETTQITLSGLEQESTSSMLDVDFEYELNPSFYTRFGFSRSTEEDTDKSGSSDVIVDTSETEVSFGGGYRSSQFDISLAYGASSGDVVKSTETSAEVDSRLVELTAFYFF